MQLSLTRFQKLLYDPNPKKGHRFMIATGTRIFRSNGYIVAVGETVGETMQDADGLFVVLDPANDGEEITKKGNVTLIR